MNTLQQQIEAAEKVRAGLVRDLEAASNKQADLKKRRSEQLAGELFGGNLLQGLLGPRDIDAALEQAARRIADVREQLGVADDHIAKLKAGEDEYQLKQDLAAWPGLCADQARDQAEYKELRHKLLVCATRLNERESKGGHMWERIQCTARRMGKGSEVWGDLPSLTDCRWNDDTMLISPAMLSSARGTVVERYGVPQQMLERAVTK